MAEIDYDNLSDEDLDALMEAKSVQSDIDSGSRYDSMSDEEIDSMLAEKTSVEDEGVKKERTPDPIRRVREVSAGIGERITRAILPEDMVRFADEIENTPIGDKLKSVRNFEKALAQTGQSFMAGGLAAGALKYTPLANTPTKALLNSDEALKVAKSIARTNVAKTALRTAIEGAVAVQPLDYENVEDRIKATVIAAELGPAISLGMGPGFKVAQNIMRRGKRILNKIDSGIKTTYVGTKRDPRIPAYKQAKKQLDATKNAAKKYSDDIKNEIKKSNPELSDELSKTKEGIKKQYKDRAGRVKGYYKNKARKLDAKTSQFDSELKEVSYEEAKNIQPKLNKFFGRNGSAYGKELDSISDAMSENVRITSSDANEMIERVLSQHSDDVIQTNPILKKLRSLVDEPGLTPDGAPKPVGKYSLQNGGNEISFKELLTDMRTIWRDAYKGNRLKPEGIPGAQLQAEFGELVSTLPGGENFKALQESYRPVISYMSRLADVFKPQKGVAYLSQAEGLIKQIAKGEGKITDKELINFMENGTAKFAKGLGSETARSKQVAENMKVIENQMLKNKMREEALIMRIAKEEADKLSQLDNLSEKQAAELAKNAETKIAKIQAEADKHLSKINNRISQLEGRQDLIASLQAKSQTLKRLSIAASTVIGGLIAKYVVTRGGREFVQILSEQ